MRASLPPSVLLLLPLLLLSVVAVAAGGRGISEDDDVPADNTVPAVPVVQPLGNRTCRLDLSDELFGGVAEACGRDLDRGRCCPVLAAWLFAAHARSALEVRAAGPADDGTSSPVDGRLGSDLPMMPDDSQRCVDSLQSSLRGRGIHLARPNSTCDAVICFCGIRLHQIGSLSCPAAFNLSSYRNATPTAAVRELMGSCRNSSYAGCTRCLKSLDKLKGGVVGASGRGGAGDRAGSMLGRDCQLMGLTWLLARNRTAYIPTVSAVLRAIMYSAHPAEEGQRDGGRQPEYRCSPDQENMPLAVDSLQFERLDDVTAAATAAAAAAPHLGAGSALRHVALLFFSLLLLCYLLAL